MNNCKRFTLSGRRDWLFSVNNFNFMPSVRKYAHSIVKFSVTIKRKNNAKYSSSKSNLFFLFSLVLHVIFDSNT